jgi:hypothetical protein
VLLAETKEALLGRCQACEASWERLPHYVYGYAWYRGYSTTSTPSLLLSPKTIGGCASAVEPSVPNLDSPGIDANAGPAIIPPDLLAAGKADVPRAIPWLGLRPGPHDGMPGLAF